MSANSQGSAANTLEAIDPHKLWVSASGGRTSMMMARLIQLTWPDVDIPFVFANTGQEHNAHLGVHP